MRINGVRDARECGGICCAVDKFAEIKEKPNAFTFNTDNNDCFCKVYRDTHAMKHFPGESGKC